MVPNKLLTTIGRMQRPDIQTAWKEKITICILIALAYMIFFGKILCPDYDRVWNALEVSYHQGSNDYYASISDKILQSFILFSIQI
jgi:chitin synthase